MHLLSLEQQNRRGVFNSEKRKSDMCPRAYKYLSGFLDTRKRLLHRNWDASDADQEDVQWYFRKRKSDQRVGMQTLATYFVASEKPKTIKLKKKYQKGIKLMVAMCVVGGLGKFAFQN